jgi:hypothetical protein
VVHDGFYPESGCHVKDYVGIFGELLYEFLIANITLNKSELIEDVYDIFSCTSGKIVEDCDLVTSCEKGIREMRADKSGSTSD